MPAPKNSRIQAWINYISPTKTWKTQNKILVLISLFIAGFALMGGRKSYTPDMATLAMNQEAHTMRDTDKTTTHPHINLLTTSVQIESWATNRIQLHQFQEWTLTLKTEHTELPNHEETAAKFNDITSALYSLVEKTSALNAQAQWDIGLFFDEYKISFKQGSKTFADSTYEMAVKLLGLTNSLTKSAEAINIAISNSLSLHEEGYNSLATSQIQVQNELRQSNFIGFQFVLGSEWKQKRQHQLDFELAGLKLLQGTGFLLSGLQTKIKIFQKNLDVLKESILDRQGMKKGKNRGLQVILNSFYVNNHPGNVKNDS